MVEMRKGEKSGLRTDLLHQVLLDLKPIKNAKKRAMPLPKHLRVYARSFKPR